MRSGFTHFTRAFPNRLVENSEAPFNQWKRECRRAGVDKRYVAHTETIQGLAIAALEELFVRGGAQPLCTAMVLACTRTEGDEHFSIQKTAAEIGAQFNIKVTEGINYACSGFSAAVARALVLREEHEHVAVVCSEVASHGLNYEDPATAVLFGDGAGATSITPEGSHKILSAWAEEVIDPSNAIGAEQGTFADFHGNKRLRTVFRMSGDKTFTAAVHTLTDVTLPEIDRYKDEPIIIVPHQPSRPVLEQFERSLRHKDYEQNIIFDVKDGGNLVSASVPVALSKHMEAMPKGTMVLCPTVGGGPNLEKGKMSKGMVVFMKG